MTLNDFASLDISCSAGHNLTYVVINGFYTFSFPDLPSLNRFIDYTNRPFVIDSIIFSFDHIQISVH